MLALSTGDAVPEIPGRGQRFDVLDAIGENDLRMFATMAEIGIRPMDRFASADGLVRRAAPAARFPSARRPHRAGRGVRGLASPRRVTATCTRHASGDGLCDISSLSHAGDGCARRRSGRCR
ncbi:MAG: hypothetical protein KGN77_05330 [Xanthomonadaceae bacterium]|nr:hypothetical protein [Xanthomonadaceae bacterium]MDE1963333.1 hypothetical protein [Xanthomonadaceae bacterium]